MNEKNVRLFIPVACGIALFLGFESGGFQLVLLNIASEFNLTTTMMGVLVASQYTAITLVPLSCGWIADRIGKRLVLLIFMPVFAGGCLVAALSGGIPVFIIGGFLIGAGYSVCECIASSALSDSFPGHENRYLNIMQCAFSLGAVISPLLFNWLISTHGFTWRSVFLFSGCGYVLLYPLMFFSRCRTAETAPQRMAFGAAFRSHFLVVLLFSMLIYVAMETGIAYFADSFFVMEYSNTELGAYAISGYWFAMAVSRFFFSRMRMRPRSMVLMGFLASALLFIPLLIVKNQWLLLMMFITIGAMMGPVWPMIIGMGTSSYQKISGTIASILTAAGGFGGVLTPILIGVVAEHTGLYGGIWYLVIISIIGFSIMKVWGKQVF
ncbi:MAG: MFS transporter [Treponema sp.]|nr:MFS transporter [Treponema sp.]